MSIHVMKEDDLKKLLGMAWDMGYCARKDCPGFAAELATESTPEPVLEPQAPTASTPEPAAWGQHVQPKTPKVFRGTPEQVADLMASMNMTSRDFARVLSVHNGTIYNWVDGRTRPTPSNVRKMRKFWKAVH